MTIIFLDKFLCGDAQRVEGPLQIDADDLLEQCIIGFAKRHKARLHDAGIVDEYIHSAIPQRLGDDSGSNRPGANASGDRRLVTVTSMFLRAKAWARA
jgi:hypothetical protein